MKRQTLLKSTLCLLMALLCNVAWAQEAQTFTHERQTAAPVDGYYLMYSESSSGNGWIHYDATQGKKYRVATDVNLSSGVTADQAKFIWKLVNNGETFTLLNLSGKVYMPADATRNQNMSATTPANLAIEPIGGDGNDGKWFVSQTNYKNGANILYIHTNTPGGYPNLSYWDSKSVGGTSICAQFYKVDMPETTYTVNYLLGEEQVATTTFTYPTGFEVPEVLIKEAVPDGYYMVSSALTENIYTVNIVLDIRPVPGKKYYIFNKHQSGYQYYYDNEGSMGFADACNYNDKTYIWLCEKDGENFRFKNVSTNKYFGWKGLADNGYNWVVSSERGSGKVMNDGCVTLKNPSGTYLVGKVGKVFDQANGAGFDNATYSSDFCFVEYTHKPQPGKYYYFYNKHLKGDKYFYDNNGSVGFSATKEAFNKNYIWLCEEDANNPGMVTFKNLGTNKYFVWKGLSTTALAWTVDETVGNQKVVNEGCVTLTANQSGSNVLVVKNATGWDHSTRAGYYDETYSSDYCFEEFSVLPQDGQTYFIYNDNDAPLYLNNNGGALKASEGKVLKTSHMFVCQKYGDVYYFKNLAGRWLAHKELKDVRHGFNITEDIANNFGCATLWTGGSTSRYFCIKKDGTLDHAKGAFNKSNSDFSTDFVFEPCREKMISLSIAAPDYAKATLTINGIEYATSAKVSFFPTVAPTISISHINHGFEFAGFVDASGNPYDLANLASITENLKLTAKYNAVFFSSTYGEKWVRLQNCSNDTYWATTDGSNGKTAALDYTDTKQLWCLVGDAESFVLYNMAVGDQKALKVNAATYANGNLATLEADLNATWKLKSKDFGHALVPTHNTNNSELGINMYGGPGGDLKLFTTGNTNTGSYWIIEMADVTNSFTYGAEVVGTAWDGRHGVADITFTVNGTTCKTHHIEGDLEAKTYYLPKNAVVKFSSRTFRGYTLTTLPELDNFCNFEGVLSKGGPYEFNLTYTANDERTLFYSPRDGHPYRIPAIATAPNGDIFAICDYRPCGNDIGYGEVDLVCRVSSDNGVTWTEEKMIADGRGDAYAANDTSKIWQVGFGDPAIVADRESNKVLVMSVCGNQTCWDGTFGEANQNPNRVARLYITYDEEKKEWVYGEPEEVTYSIYPKFVDKDGNVHAASLFIGAGKICQSRVVKKGDYYRLYCAVWNVTKTQRQHHNYVIYSDDFGQTWEVLGDLGYANSPAPAGNEPKCEELPDGSVVLSSRKYNGRYFNLFTFDNEGKTEEEMYTTGSWGTVASSNDIAGGLSFGGNSTNGEIYKVKAIRKADGKICDVMLQSVPTGGGRDNVAIFYKEMEYNADGTNKYTPQTFSTGWTKGIHVSTKGSCYSTMILQADGRLGFFFEEEPGGYCMVYIPYTIEDVTDDKYSLYQVESTIGQYGVGTFYASEAMQIPEGVKAYVATEEPEMKGADAEGNATGVITMTELEGIIPAHTGAVLRGDADTYNFIPSISYGTTVENNMLVGYEGADNKTETKKEVTLADGYTTYVLTVVNEKAGFYKKEDDFKVYNNKAYLQVPAAVSANALRIRIEGEQDDYTTEIVMPVANGQQPTVIYDLTGRRVQKVQKGLYIVNGKKVWK